LCFGPSSSGSTWSLYFQDGNTIYEVAGFTPPGFIPPTLCGPFFPPPLGVTFSSSGNISTAGGVNWDFQNTVLAGSNVVYWGATNGGVKLSFDNGQNYSGAEIMTYSASSDLPNGKVVWTGSSFWPCGGAVYTR